MASSRLEVWQSSTMTHWNTIKQWRDADLGLLCTADAHGENVGIKIEP